MNTRIAKKILKRTLVYHCYKSEQVRKALFIFLRNWTKKERYQLLSEIISASCDDVYPWRFGNPLLDYSEAKRLSVAFKKVK